MEPGFLFIKKRVLGDSIPVSRCVRSKTSQAGVTLDLGAAEPVQHRLIKLQISEIIILGKQDTHGTTTTTKTTVAGSGVENLEMTISLGEP